MDKFDGRVAVITGGASGFGKEFARIGAQLKMKLVLADVQQDALDATRAYDGARRDRRTSGWDARRGSAHTSIAGALGDLRDRSRDLARNSFIGARALDVLTAQIVGTGITMKAATGKDRDDRILDEARQRAEDMIADAEERAQSTVARAEAEAVRLEEDARGEYQETT